MNRCSYEVWALLLFVPVHLKKAKGNRRIQLIGARAQPQLDRVFVEVRLWIDSAAAVASKVLWWPAGVM
jgi:hypothetical protein